MGCLYCGNNIDHKHKGAKYCNVVCMQKGYKVTDLRAYFFRNIKKHQNGCWLWAGSKNVYGYGRIGTSKGSVYAHRLSYQIHKGKIKRGMFICHKCDNPSCVNPDHLFQGTPMDNNHDMIKKGRRVIVRGEDRPESKLKEKQVAMIFKDDRTHKAIALDYGVSRELVTRIKNNKAWKHVTEKL